MFRGSVTFCGESLRICGRLFCTKPYTTVTIDNFVIAGNEIIKEGTLTMVPWDKDKIKKTNRKEKLFRLLPSIFRPEVQKVDIVFGENNRDIKSPI